MKWPEAYFEEGRFCPGQFASDLMSDYDIITLSDTKEMLFYDREKHIWQGRAAIIIDGICKKTLGDLYAGRHSDEVKRHVEAATYTERSKLNGTKSKINMENGVLDTETLQLEEHNKDYYFTYRIPIKYNPKAYPDRILGFLKSTYGENPMDAIHILEYAAYVFVDGYPYKKALCLVGAPDTGKTSVLRLLLHFFDGLHASISLQEICDDRFSVRDLYGKKVNVADDLGDVTLKASDKFKKITGASPLRGEAKYERAFTFINDCKQIFACNILPHIREKNDLAFFSRWILVENKRQFDSSSKIPAIWEKLTSEEQLSGLMNLLLLFRAKIIESGFEFDRLYDTEDIRSRWLAYTNEKPEHDFCNTYITEVADGVITKEDLYVSYKQYCQENGLTAKGQGEFTIIVKEHFVNVREGDKGSRKQQKSAFRGIALKEQKNFKTMKDFTTSSFEEVITEYIKQFSNNISGKIRKVDFLLFWGEGRRIEEYTTIPTEASLVSPPTLPHLPLKEFEKCSFINMEFSDQEKPPAAPSAQEPTPQGPDAWAALMDGLEGGILIGSHFEHAPEEFRERLEAMARAGAIFQPRAGIWQRTPLGGSV